MDKKIFWGNFIGVLSTPFMTAGLIKVFTNPIVGVILISVGLILLFIAIFIQSQINEVFGDSEEPTPTECTENKEDIAQREREYEMYLDAKTTLMIQSFSILSDKRMNKETRAKKLRKIIRSNPFNVDKFDD